MASCPCACHEKRVLVPAGRRTKARDAGGDAFPEGEVRVSRDLPQIRKLLATERPEPNLPGLQLLASSSGRGCPSDAPNLEPVEEHRGRLRPQHQGGAASTDGTPHSATSRAVPRRTRRPFRAPALSVRLAERKCLLDTKCPTIVFTSVYRLLLWV